ncbi:hypothetical protein L7F22_066641 [Adiantum nelumboides]|nr:hypothetical protein [Adiantum nelumboides]
MRSHEILFEVGLSLCLILEFSSKFVLGYMEEANSLFARSRGPDASNWALNEEIENCLVEIQSLCDKHRASVEMQDELLRLLFGGLGISKGKQPAYAPKKSLASLLVQKPSNWDGQLNGRHIPSNWSQLMEFYKDLGMVPLQEWKLCLGNDDHPHAPHIMEPSLEDERQENDAYKCCCTDMHIPRLLRRDCEHCCQRCPLCRKKRKDVMSFHFIPLMGQLKLLCRSETICWDFLKMWRAKEAWLNNIPSMHPEYIYEFWHGEKLRIFQDFWNPLKEWETPVICEDPKCKRAHMAFPKELMCTQLQKSWCPEQGYYFFRCSKCGKQQRAKKSFVKGDPRNFALLLHWDGFQAASTTQKDSAVVEIVVLNGGKGSFVGSIPVLFLPLSHKDLQKKHGDVLSSFLSPLISELESSFLNGFEVNYAVDKNRICDVLHDEPTRLRCMLMMCTGDHPAQCKLGQVKDGGMAFCRRDKAKAELIRDVNGTQRYVYNNNRYQGRYPPPKRNVDELWHALKMSKRCLTKEKAEDTLRDGGLAGESVLWRLYHLYAFDISKDLVFDVMHILSLNLFQKYIKHLMSSTSTQVKRRIDIAINEVAQAIPKPILHGGRWPKNASVHFKMFKAEECQKFIQWCLPHILNVVDGISEKDIQLGMLLVDISHMFFDCSRKQGWTQEYIDVCRSLLLSWRILSEEYYGANSSPLEHVAGNGEILDDVIRHASHDVTWCFSHERNVSGYLSISTNNKSNELSYSKFHSRILCTQLYKQLHLEKDGLTASTRDMLVVHSCLLLPEGVSYVDRVTCFEMHKNCAFHTSSEKKANDVWDACHRATPCQCQMMISRKGVLVGPKRPKLLDLDAAETKGMVDFWLKKDAHLFSPDDIQSTARFYSKVFLNNVKYTTGEFVVFQGSLLSESQEICFRGCLKKIFAHEQRGNVNVFVVIEYLLDNSDAFDEISGMHIIDKCQNRCYNVTVEPIECIQHKFFWLCTSGDDKEVLYETIGFDVRKRLLLPGKVGCIPPWLEKDDLGRMRDLEKLGWIGNMSIKSFKKVVGHGIIAEKYGSRSQCVSSDSIIKK